MPRPKRVQAALKDAQKNRIDAKFKKGYVDSTDKHGNVSTRGYLSNQPTQMAMAAKNEEIRAARAEHAAAVEDFQVAEITGKDLEAKREAAAVAVLVLQNLEATKQRRRGVSLTNAGSI